jgi:hypothetical protein
MEEMGTPKVESAMSRRLPMPDLEDNQAEEVGDWAGEVEADEEVIPQDPILFPLIEELRLSEERKLGLTQAAPSNPLNPAHADAVLERINEREARS